MFWEYGTRCHRALNSLEINHMHVTVCMKINVSHMTSACVNRLTGAGDAAVSLIMQSSARHVHRVTVSWEEAEKVMQGRFESVLIPIHHPYSHLITIVIYQHISTDACTRSRQERANRCIMGDGVERNPGLVKARAITPEQIYQLHVLTTVTKH